jgi:membrane-bound lytic murein transglycosylase B
MLLKPQFSLKPRFFLFATFLITVLCLTVMCCSYAQITLAQSTNLTPDQEAQLRAQLADIESQIKQQQDILDSKATEGQQYQHDIDVLNAQIKKAQLKIKASELSISKLGKDITVKTNTISALGDRINNGLDSLEQIIQRTREIDNNSYVEAFLSSKNISDFFIDLDSFTSIKQSLSAHLEDIKQAKDQTETAKQELDTQRNQEIDTKASIENEQAIIQQAEDQKKNLLALNKNEQQNYKTSIANNTIKANQIRNQLFQLRDASAIKFGDAVTYAKAASAITGTRAAFILAIIQQESNLGANVGQCLLTDATTGAGIKKSTGAVITNLMKPSRDVQPFLTITAALGRDPYKTVVSCPLDVGYGGAMGPSQFIPSTWQLFSDRIASALGKTASDPWNPQDAFMASGFYLSDLGAGAQTYTAERNAACRYYSGRSCSGSNTFYGNQVMARVSDIQNNINILGGN